MSVNPSVNTAMKLVVKTLQDPKNNELEVLLKAFLDPKNKDPKVLANRIARCLAEFEFLLKNGPERKVIPFSDVIWRNLQNSLEILDLETSIKLLVILDPNLVYTTCLYNYRQVSDRLKEKPSEDQWNCIMDTLHSLVRFKSDVREMLLNEISVQAGKAAAVIGAVPNPEEIEEMNGLLKELESKE